MPPIILISWPFAVGEHMSDVFAAPHRVQQQRGEQRDFGDPSVMLWGSGRLAGS